MTLTTLKTYGAIKERAQYVSLEDDLRKIEEMEKVFEYIPNRENRFIFRLFCMGYTYNDIGEHLEKNGYYFTAGTIRSKVSRIIKRLKKEGVISNG